MHDGLDIRAGAVELAVEGGLVRRGVFAAEAGPLAVEVHPTNVVEIRLGKALFSSAAPATKPHLVGAWDPCAYMAARAYFHAYDTTGCRDLPL